MATSWPLGRPNRENLLTGKRSKSTACTFWLEAEKREMEAEEKGRSEVLVFPSTFSGMNPRGRNVGEPSNRRSAASICVQAERQSSLRLGQPWFEQS